MEQKLPEIRVFINEMKRSGFNNLSAITNQVQREFNLTRESATKAILNIIKQP